ncbi:MAG: type II toxin-antitoxin system RelE/ParE family toxin [Spirosomataceae bacterium]
MRSEIESLGETLQDNPFEGVPIGNGFYKIRLAIRSKGKGKRGGARVITYVKVIAETVFLVSIYDKAEQSDISQDLLQQIFEEVK